jgi:hypothetical protein
MAKETLRFYSLWFLIDDVWTTFLAKEMNQECCPNTIN